MGRFLHEVEALPLDEFLTYVALNQVDPWLPQRDDFLLAQLAMVVNRSLGGKARVKDFMPNWSGERRERDPDEMAVILQQWVRLHNARVAAREGRRDGDEGR